MLAASNLVQHEVIAVVSSEHHVHCEWLGGKGATFENLTHVNGKPEISALPNGKRGDR